MFYLIVQQAIDVLCSHSQFSILIPGRKGRSTVSVLRQMCFIDILLRIIKVFYLYQIILRPNLWYESISLRIDFGTWSSFGCHCFFSAYNLSVSILFWKSLCQFILKSFSFPNLLLVFQALNRSLTAVCCKKFFSVISLYAIFYFKNSK